MCLGEGEYYILVCDFWSEYVFVCGCVGGLVGKTLSIWLGTGR